jgi:predicted amidophosphoribosyltransferase
MQRAVSSIGARVRRAAAAALGAVYPPHCLTCRAPVADDGGLCAACWRETPFVLGLACDRCGAPQPGSPDEAPVVCDDCLHIARNWDRGRAALVYAGRGRDLVLALKHRDALHLAAPAGRWLARAGADLIRPDTLIAPVPLHWWRLFRRRYNQSAVLAAALARAVGRPCIPDLLVRTRATTTQDGRSREGRFANLAGAIAPHPRQGRRIAGRPVLLVDDVMTSGATLAACAEACWQAGADAVDVIVLARVTRDS